MSENHSVLSSCGYYVASTAGGMLDVATFTDTGPVYSYNLNQAIRRHVVHNGVEGRPRISKAVVTQLEWEVAPEGARCGKLGVVIDNYGLLMVYDLGNEEPIIIQQSKDDGIDRFEWVPPVMSQLDESSESEAGYANCKQLVVFTKHNLHMKLYSLDCTHILLTIVKPLVRRLIVPPHRDGRIWSMVAETMEYNVPPVIYHFFNQGSVSTLFQALRLPQHCLTSPSIEWSDSGRWLGWLARDDTLYGYDLKIFSLIGGHGQANGTRSIKPLMEINTSEDTKLLRENYYPSTAFSGTWILLGDDEFYLTVSTVQGELELQFASVRLLRTITRKIKMNTSVEYWKQTNDRVTNYRKYINRSFDMKTSAIKHVHILSPYICLQLESSLVFLKASSGKSLDLVIHSVLSLGPHSRQVDAFRDTLQVMIVHPDHIGLFNLESRSIRVIYRETKLKIKRARRMSDELFVETEPMNNEAISIRNWDRIRIGIPADSTSQEKRSELNALLRRNINREDSLRLGSVNSSHLEDITDTFDMRKRARIN